MTQSILNCLVVLVIGLQGLIPLVASVDGSNDQGKLRHFGATEIQATTNYYDYSGLSASTQQAVGTAEFFNSLTETQQEKAIHYATNYTALSAYISTSGASPSLTITRAQAVSLGIAGDVYDTVAWVLAADDSVDDYQTNGQWCANKKKLYKRLAQYLIAAGGASLTAGAWCHALGGPTPMQIPCFFLDILGIAGATAGSLLSIVDEIPSDAQVCINL